MSRWEERAELLKCLETCYIKAEYNILGQYIAQESWYFTKVFDEGAVEDGISQKGASLLHCRRWRKICNEFHFHFVYLNTSFGDDMVQNNTFLHHEVALLLTQNQICLFTSLRNQWEVVETLIKCGAKDKKVIHEYLQKFFHHVGKDSHHAPLESSGSIA
jgi:hypothetical protein